MFVLPIALSYLAYFVLPLPGARSYGELLPPKEITDVKLPLQARAPVQFSELRGKWVLVSFDTGPCARDCTKKLYAMRQARLTQGKDRDRLTRLWVSPAAPSHRAVVQDGVWAVPADVPGFSSQFPDTAALTDHIYLIDPLGNLMMRFPADSDPAKIAKDLRRLLRASQIG